MQKRSALWLALAISPAVSSLAFASGEADYVSAFGVESALEATEEAAPEHNGTDSDSLRSVGSFPVRVHRGERDNLEWTNVERRNYLPKPAVRKFRAGKCAFRVSTGEIGLTRYEFREDTHEVSVNTDPVLRYSTLQLGVHQGLLVSINAELFAEPLPGSEAACKNKFLGKKVRFGKADMGLSELTLEPEAGVDLSDHLKAEPYRPQSETPVYLTWSEATNRLELVGKGGLAPAVESPVFLVKPRVNGDYYLKVSPKLAIERKKR